MEQIKNLWFDADRIYMRSSEGRVLSRPLKAYPELEEATVEQRNDFMIDEDGMAVRWESLDADMHISSFYETTEPNQENEVGQMFKRFPWLNVSEVARLSWYQQESFGPLHLWHLKAQRAAGSADTRSFSCFG